MKVSSVFIIFIVVFIFTLNVKAAEGIWLNTTSNLKETDLNTLQSILKTRK